MDKSIYKHIVELFNEKQNFVIATILNRSGSVPREEGTKMVIKKDLSIIGTIGGGILEACVIKAARSIFLSKNEFLIKKFNLNNEDASLEGMVCGGELRVFMEYIDAEDMELKKIYEIALEFNRNRKNFAMITQISKSSNLLKGKKWLCTETNFYGIENQEAYAVYRKISENFNCIKVEVLTTIQKVDSKEFIGNDKCLNMQTTVVNSMSENDTSIFNEGKYLVEPLLNYETVFIVGGGHIAQKLAQITKMIDFRTIVIDDRSEFANKNRFPDADEIIVLNSFESLLDKIKLDNQSYIVIVTRGHMYDKYVLGQVLKFNVKYIGMIGSKKKKEFIYNSLLSEGYTKEDLSRVHSPIGLSIFAETPEEIAVSIAGELIKIRRENKNAKTV